MYRLLPIILITFLFTDFSWSQPPSIENMNRAREHFNAGVKKGITSDFENAIEDFNNAIELNPLYAEAYLYKGLAEIETNNFEQAVRDFTITIELDPAFSDQAHYFRGVSRYFLEQYEAAIEDLSVAILMNPDFVSFYQRGKANLKLKEYRRSIQDFDIALRLQEDFYEGYLYRGINLYYLEDYEEAMHDLELAKKHLPKNAEAHYYSGLVRLKIRNSYVAIEDLDKALALNPELSQAYEARANARQNTGNITAAEQDRQKAAALHEKPAVSASATSPSPGTRQAKPGASTEINFAELFSSSTQESQPADNPQSKPEPEPQLTAAPASFAAPADETQKPQPAANNVTDFAQLESGTYGQDFQKLPLRGFGVQVASYSGTDNLSSLAKAYEKKYAKPVYVNVSNVNGRVLYKLIIGRFDTRNPAEAFRDKLRNDDFPDSFLVVFENL